jgi:hypothetical protein
MTPDVDSIDSSSNHESQSLHRRSLGDGLLVTLVIVGPAFLFGELWHGKPIIDQRGYLWVLPASVMTLGYYIGGSIAGHHSQKAERGFLQGLVVALLTTGLIFLVDMIRRLVQGQAITISVIGLWAAAAAIAILVAGIGGGQRWRRVRKRNQ